MVLLQNSGEDSRERRNSFPVLSMDLQRRGGGAEGRQRSVLIRLKSSEIFREVKFDQEKCSFLVLAFKVFEDDHPVLLEHRQKELAGKKQLYTCAFTCEISALW